MSRSRQYWRYQRVPTRVGRIGKVLAVVVAVVCAGFLISLSGGPKTSDSLNDAPFGGLAQERAGADGDRGEADQTRRGSGAEGGDAKRSPDKSARERADTEVPASAPQTRTADRATRKRADTTRTAPAVPAPADPTPAVPAPAATPNELAIRVVTHLAAVRREVRRRLARARTAGPQAEAARELEAAFGNAARRIERLDTDGLTGLSAALRRGERAYAGLAAAISKGDQRKYDVQRKAVGAAEADVERETSVLA